jgi:hypothetical protein
MDNDFGPEASAPISKRYGFDCLAQEPHPVTSSRYRRDSHPNHAVNIPKAVCEVKRRQDSGG